MERIDRPETVAVKGELAKQGIRLRYQREPLANFLLNFGELPWLHRPRPVGKALRLSIESLNIGARSYNCLGKVGLATLGLVTMYTADELMFIPNFGKGSLSELKAALAEFNLALRES